MGNKFYLHKKENTVLSLFARTLARVRESVRRVSENIEVFARSTERRINGLELVNYVKLRKQPERYGKR